MTPTAYEQLERKKVLIYPTYDSLPEAIMAAQIHLQIHRNELLPVLYGYHNTLIQDLQKIIGRR
ncbi:hypothetical protein GCM10011348_15990 [Marinobacterium nitratireducens]|uniref:Uncharacterized protein n=1 Tax=Marinobacterium nitratireducens TaxID=518897 RepID=A0A918DS04_9GAMM|nr:hypothetical protein [Marinobacterium nitratireducens]GGO80085.1 hypothetical protein GCM10011348_15990 [Marinobacterium nitratireducens]